MEKRAIEPEAIYAPTWDFSQAIEVSGAGRLLFVSGIMGFRKDGSISESMAEQSDQAYRNLAEVLAAAGGSLADIVKVTVFVGEDYPDHREEMREIRSRHFTARPFPASTLVRVAGFAGREYKFEIEAVAALS